MAADLPYRNQMPEKAPAYVPAFSRTGFYIGVNGGGAFGTSTHNFDALGSPSFDTSGGLAGGTIGFNYQTGLSTCLTKNDWFATTRGRLGYAFDRVLPSVTGGAAFGDIKVVCRRSRSTPPTPAGRLAAASSMRSCLIGPPKSRTFTSTSATLTVVWPAPTLCRPRLICRPTSCAQA